MSPLQLTWGYLLPTICPGMNIVTLFVRRRIQLLVFLDESYLVVLRRLRTRLILHLYAPKLEYASSAWDPHMQRNIDKIEMVQRRAVRFVYNDYSRYSHVSPMIKALGWDSLEYRRLNNQVFMFYKIYKGLVGISRNTRASRSPNCAPFHQRATLNDTYKYSFYPRAIRPWNSVPLSLIPDSLDEFKAIISSM